MTKPSCAASVVPSKTAPTPIPSPIRLTNLPLDNPKSLLAPIASGMVDKIAYGIPSAAAAALALPSSASAPLSRISPYTSAVPMT